MPFVVPQQQQPQPATPQTPQQQPQPMPRGGMNLQSMNPMQTRIGMQGGGQPLPRYGGGPLSISNPQQRPQQFYGGGGGDPRQMQMQQMMQAQQMMRNPYQQQGGAGGRPMPWGYESYNKAGNPGMHQDMMYAGGPGGFDENTGAMRTPPPSNPAALSLISSNGAPAGGVYSPGFNQQPAPTTSPIVNPYARTTGRGGGTRY